MRRRVGDGQHAFRPAKQFAPWVKQLHEDLGAFAVDGIDQPRNGGMQSSEVPMSSASV